ncbi:hypothetical protein ACSBR2_011054 [Camellia fascicularis]
MIFLLSLLFLLAHTTQATIPCPTVTARAASCVMFATGKDSKPSDECCSGLQLLAQSMKSVEDKKDIYRCLKNNAKNMGLQDKFLSQIPSACKINVGFAVSATTNCET